MTLQRRHFLTAATVGAAAWRSAAQTPGKAGIPGPFPGRVAAVEHPGCIVSGQYQREAVRDMVQGVQVSAPFGRVEVALQVFA